jgi:hypothetical protein
VYARFTVAREDTVNRQEGPKRMYARSDAQTRLHFDVRLEPILPGKVPRLPNDFRDLGIADLNAMIRSALTVAIQMDICPLFRISIVAVWPMKTL